MLRPLLTAILLLGATALADEPPPPHGGLACDSIISARYQFTGVVGARVEANLDGWLLRAPGANPGMLEMFRVRDREPVPKLVPWAGEFAGKYLLSAVGAARMTERGDVWTAVGEFVKELIATQAEDGYLGPFPKDRRLRGEWDLWGHYHVIQGLLAWYELTGDVPSLLAARRAADLICDTYLGGKARVIDAGSEEMNMAVIHALVHLYRITGKYRYMDMAREIEKDWTHAGNYVQAGFMGGMDFYKTSRPRWESLHDLQGLTELWRVTGDMKYRSAFEHFWRSIQRCDVHNAGSFSSGEKATGNAYAPGAIETCCTVAWMALSVDMLRLTGDPQVADALELSTLNGGLGAQHPTGRWWTYNTPMDGVREASAHSIVFQARAGTPELNCCSVNGPRVLGMLADWAVMRGESGVLINAHFPGDMDVGLARLHCATDYPRSGRVTWTVHPVGDGDMTLRFRIPAWSAKTVAKLNGVFLEAKPGTYLDIRRQWKGSDEVELQLDMSLRAVPGEREQAGRVSLYRGPLLLAYDQKIDTYDEADIPPVDLSRLSEARVLPPTDKGPLAPWITVELPGERRLWLCDFASAGAYGTLYRSWLPTAK